MQPIAVGCLVRPNHIGTEIDWRRCKGRVTALWHTPGTAGEPVADIVWLRGPHRYTHGYPIAMLTADK